jgi:hypothetical protein
VVVDDVVVVVFFVCPGAVSLGFPRAVVVVRSGCVVGGGGSSARLVGGALDVGLIVGAVLAVPVVVTGGRLSVGVDSVGSGLPDDATVSAGVFDTGLFGAGGLGGGGSFRRGATGGCLFFDPSSLGGDAGELPFAGPGRADPPVLGGAGLDGAPVGGGTTRAVGRFDPAVPAVPEAVVGGVSPVDSPTTRSVPPAAAVMLYWSPPRVSTTLMVLASSCVVVMATPSARSVDSIVTRFPIRS